MGSDRQDVWIFSLEAAGAFRTSKVGRFSGCDGKGCLSVCLSIVDVVHTVVEVSVKLI